MVINYFDVWAPYWSYIEDFYLDIESLKHLMELIQSPVLVVGAGQGLLVEELLKQNLQVTGIDLSRKMIQYAKDRRGLELIHADARKIPFNDQYFQTSIIATGVLDFMDDEELIQQIISEVRRVTDASGKVLIAFNRFHPRAEELMRYTGLISEDNQWCFRETYVAMSQKPHEFFASIQKNPNVSTLGALLAVIKTELLLPRKEKAARNRWRKAWEKIKREVENPQQLIDCVPEYIPYRNKTQIQDLFRKLNFQIQQIHELYSCIVVQL